MKSRTLFQHAVAISTSLLVVAAIIWSGLSMIRFEQAINPGNADLTELLRDLSGLIRADQIFTLVVFGCGCLCLVAIAASQTLPKTAAESTTDSNIDS